MTLVQVRAVREGRLWVLHLDDGGVTQVRRLSEVEDMVADYVSLMRDVPVDSIQVEVVAVDPGEDLARTVETARAAQQSAVKAVETAAALARKAAADLKRKGLSGVEVSRVLGVSPQRVSQLTTSAKSPAPAPRTAKRAASAEQRTSKSATTMVAIHRSSVAAEAVAGNDAISFLTVAEAADRLRIHPQTLYRLIREHKIDVTRVGGKVLISEVAVEAFITTNTRMAAKLRRARGKAR